MSQKGYITSKDLAEIKAEVEKDPHVKIDWTFSGDEKKNKPAHDIDINWFLQTKIEDHEQELIYFIYSITNISKNKIFAEVTIGFESKTSLAMPEPLPIVFVEIKRIKHPEFYALKKAEQLRKVIFPIRLERVEDQYFKCKNYLNYIYPKSTHYYMLRFKPAHYFPIREANTNFRCDGTFI